MTTLAPAVDVRQALFYFRRNSSPLYRSLRRFRAALIDRKYFMFRSYIRQPTIGFSMNFV
jgi:hypothetical protein